MATPIMDLAMKLIETPLDAPEFPALMEARAALSEDNKTALFFAVLWEAKSRSHKPAPEMRTELRGKVL